MGDQIRALIVEDVEDDATLLVRELRRGGYDPTIVRVQTASALEAALREQAWDIVFSDWSMPELTAPEALELFQHADLDIPFIIVSGTVGEEVAVEALRAGAHDFVVKDRLTRLLPAVERELREAAGRRESAKVRAQLLISDRMASIGVLAAGIAHEINNPLASLLVNLELACEEVEHLQAAGPDALQTNELVAELQDARDSAVRIRNIVRDLKLFSRSPTTERGAVQVEPVLESSVRMAWNEIRHRARLSKDLRPIPLVDADESKLGQVFLNLLLNAAQSIPEGHAADNEIAIATAEETDGSVCIEVRDTGSGIAPEVMERLFTPFFTTKPIGVGTGLGLSICHRIITSFGGEIQVHSEVGKGTTFRVILQRATSKPTPSQRAPVVHQAGRRGRVLIVDDELVVGHAVRRTLQRDHDVEISTSARRSLAQIRDGSRYDLILCDLMMPELSGAELHAALADVAPEQADRMIFLTGGAFTPAAVAFLNAPARRSIEKPFEGAALRGLVNELIGRD